MVPILGEDVDTENEINVKLERSVFLLLFLFLLKGRGLFVHLLSRMYSGVFVCMQTHCLGIMAHTVHNLHYLYAH